MHTLLALLFTLTLGTPAQAQGTLASGRERISYRCGIYLNLETHVDMDESLPFYSPGNQVLSLPVAWVQTSEPFVSLPRSETIQAPNGNDLYEVTVGFPASYQSNLMEIQIQKYRPHRRIPRREANEGLEDYQVRTFDFWRPAGSASALVSTQSPVGGVELGEDIGVLCTRQ